MSQIFNKTTLAQAVKYAAATVLSACCTLVLPVILHEFLLLTEKTAVAVSLVTAFFVNFLTTRNFVFKSSGEHVREITLFALASFVFRGFEYGAFVVLFDYFKIYYIAALILVLPLSMVFKFLVYKFIIFRPVTPAGQFSHALKNMDEANRTYHVVQDHMQLLPNYYEWIYGRVKDYMKNTVVELGCGAGFGIRSYIDSADKVYAVDHSPELLARVKDAYPGGKMETIKADLMEDWKELAPIRADAVVLMDVLEHFRDDRTFLEKTKNLLKPGGHVIIKVPADSRLYGAIDRASGHYRRYDAGDLAALGDQLGLKLVELKPVNIPGAFIYGLRKEKNSNFSKTFSRGQLKLINRAIPFIRFADDILRLVPGFRDKGLSLIAVYQAA